MNIETSRHGIVPRASSLQSRPARPPAVALAVANALALLLAVTIALAGAFLRNEAQPRQQSLRSS